MQEPQLKYRIGKVTGWIITGIALLADLLQVLLDLTIVLSPLADIVTLITEGFIILYFFFCRVRFLAGKKAFSRILALLVETIIEMVPILDALPTLSAATAYQIHTSRVEDEQEYEAAHAKWAEETKRQQDRVIAALVYQENMERIQQEARERRMEREAEADEMEDAELEDA